MLVPALVLIAAAVVVGAVGVLARAHRLPRNRVIGVRTTWTMSSVDAFRRANRVAAPAFLGAGAVGIAAGAGALAAPSTTAGATLLVMGALGLLLLVSLAGVVGMRFAETDEADARAAAPGPCTLPAPDTDPAPGTAAPATEPDCAPAERSGCAGACTLCPRAGALPGSAHE